MDTHIDKGEIIIYQPDKTTQFEVRIEDETVWLTQAQMVDLFGRDRTVITKHISNIFKENELVEKGNVHFLHSAISDKPVKLYLKDTLSVSNLKILRKNYNNTIKYLQGMDSNLNCLSKQYYHPSRVSFSTDKYSTLTCLCQN